AHSLGRPGEPLLVARFVAACFADLPKHVRERVRGEIAHARPARPRATEAEAREPYIIILFERAPRTEAVGETRSGAQHELTWSIGRKFLDHGGPNVAVTVIWACTVPESENTGSGPRVHVLPGVAGQPIGASRFTQEAR